MIYGGGSGDGISGFTELSSASNNRLTIRGANAYVGIAIGAEAKAGAVLDDRSRHIDALGLYGVFTAYMVKSWIVLVVLAALLLVVNWIYFSM